MSIGIYWANNAKQNISLFNSIQRSSMERLVYFTGYLRQEPNQSDKCVESCVAGESDQSCECTSATATCSSRTASTATSSGSSGTTSSTDNAIDPIIKHGDSCSCPNCREYADYTEHIADLIDPERERTSTGLWIGNELRTAKQTDTRTTNDIEHITGISTGVTV